jgi:putative acetyltransferase
MTGATLIRPARAADMAQVRAVLVAAFGGRLEADVAERLLADGDLVLALVAEQEDAVVGYAAFPRLTLDLGGRCVPVAGLAPVGVRPDRQHGGIGRALIEAGIARLKDRGERLAFVLGDPTFYGRFGFAAMDGFVSRYAGPYFQALRLFPDAPARGRVSYPRAFDELR